MINKSSKLIIYTFVLLSWLHFGDRAYANQANAVSGEITPDRVEIDNDVVLECTFEIIDPPNGTFDELRLTFPFNAPMFPISCTIDGDNKAMMYFAEGELQHPDAEDLVHWQTIDGTLVIYTFASIIQSNMIVSCLTHTDSVASRYLLEGIYHDSQFQDEPAAITGEEDLRTVTLTPGSISSLLITESDDPEEANILSREDVLSGDFIDFNIFAFDRYNNHVALVEEDQIDASMIVGDAFWRVAQPDENDQNGFRMTAERVGTGRIVARHWNSVEGRDTTVALSGNITIKPGPISRGVITIDGVASQILRTRVGNDFSTIGFEVFDEIGNEVSHDEGIIFTWEVDDRLEIEIIDGQDELIYNPDGALAMEDNTFINLTIHDVVHDIDISAERLQVINEAGIPSRIEIRSGNGEEPFDGAELIAGDFRSLVLFGWDDAENPIEGINGGWSIVGDIGTLDRSYGNRVLFSAEHANEGFILAQIENLTDNTGLISVSPSVLSKVMISLNGDGVPTPAQYLTRVAGEYRSLYIYGYDRFENFLGRVIDVEDDDFDNAVWEFTADSLGRLTANAEEGSCLFEALNAGDDGFLQGNIRFSIQQGETIFTDEFDNNITVTRNTVVNSIQIQSDANTSEPFAGADLIAGQPTILYAIGYDEQGNKIGPVAVDWSLFAIQMANPNESTPGRIEGLDGLDEGGDNGSISAGIVSFIPLYTGSCQLRIERQEGEELVVAISEGEVNVLPNPNVESIRLAEDNADYSNPFPAKTLSADTETISVYLHGFDLFGNAVEFDPANNLTYDIIQQNIGAINPTDNPFEAVFEPQSAGSGYLRAIYNRDEQDSPPLLALSGEIRIYPGALASVYATVNGSRTNAIDGTVDDIFRISFEPTDEEGNLLSSNMIRSVDWDVDVGQRYSEAEDHFSILFEPIESFLNGSVGVSVVDTAGNAQSVQGIPVNIGPGRVNNLSIMYEDNELNDVARTTDQTLSMYVIGFDGEGQNLGPIEADEWRVVGQIGELDQNFGDSVTFMANIIGTGYIEARFGQRIDRTGNITISPGQFSSPMITLSTGNDERIPPAADLIQLTAGDTISLYCHGFDADGNWRGLERADANGIQSVEWIFTEGILGEFSAEDGGARGVLTALRSGISNIQVSVSRSEGQYLEHDTLDIGIVVEPNPIPNQIIIQEQYTGNEVGDVALQAGENILLYAIGFDGKNNDNFGKGNRIGAVESVWALDNNIGQLDVEHEFGRTAVFMAERRGRCQITSAWADNQAISDQTGEITVANSDRLAYVRVTSGSEEDSPSLTGTISADSTLDFYVLPYDIYGNLMVNYTILAEDLNWEWTGENLGSENIELIEEHPALLRFSPVNVGIASIRVSYSYNQDDQQLSTEAFSGQITVQAGAVDSVSILINDTVSNQLIGSADSVYTFTVMTRDADGNLISHDRIARVIEWEDNLPVDERFYNLENQPDILRYDPRSIISPEMNCFVSVSVENQTVEIESITIKHGKPYFAEYPFNLVPARPAIRIDSTVTFTTEVRDFDNNLCTDDTFRVASDNRRINGQGPGWTDVLTDSNGILAFELAAGDNPGVATVAAQHISGPAYGRGEVIIEQMIISGIGVPNLEGGEIIDLWAGAQDIPFTVSVSNIGAQAIQVEEIQLLFSEGDGDFISRQVTNLPITINQGETREVVFEVSIRDNADNRDVVQVAASAHGALTIGSDTLDLPFELPLEDGLQIRVRPGRGASITQLRRARVTRGQQLNFSVVLSDDFELEDLILAERTNLTFYRGQDQVFSVPLQHDQTKLVNEPLELLFDSDTIPLLPVEGETLSARLNLCRRLAPANDYSLEFNLEETLTIDPQLILQISELVPDSITITQDTSFQFRITNTGSATFTIDPDRLRIYPDRGNDDEFSGLDIDRFRERYGDDSTIDPNTDLILNFSSYHFNDSTWGSGEFTPRLHVEGRDGNGMDQSGEFHFGEERFELFYPVELEDVGNFSPPFCVYNIPRTPSVRITNLGRLVITFDADSTYLAFSDRDDEVLRLMIVGNEAERSLHNNNEEKNFHFEELNQTDEEHQLHPGTDYQVDLVAGYRDQNGLYKSGRFDLEDVFQVFRNDALVEDRWSVSPNPFSTNGRDSDTVMLVLSNPELNPVISSIETIEFRSFNDDIELRNITYPRVIDRLLPGDTTQVLWSFQLDDSVSGEIGFEATFRYIIRDTTGVQDTVIMSFVYGDEEDEPLDTLRTPPSLQVEISSDYPNIMWGAEDLRFQFDFLNEGETAIDRFRMPDRNGVDVLNDQGEAIDRGLYNWRIDLQPETLQPGEPQTAIGYLSIDSSFGNDCQLSIIFNFAGLNHYNGTDVSFVATFDDLYAFEPDTIEIDRVRLFNNIDQNNFTLEQGSYDTLEVTLHRTGNHRILLAPGDVNLVFNDSTRQGPDVTSAFWVKSSLDDTIEWDSNMVTVSILLHVWPKFELRNVGLNYLTGTVQWTHFLNDGLSWGKMKTTQPEANLPNNVTAIVYEMPFVQIDSTIASTKTVTIGQSNPKWVLDIAVRSYPERDIGDSSYFAEIFHLDSCHIKAIKAVDMTELTGFQFTAVDTFTDGSSLLNPLDVKHLLVTVDRTDRVQGEVLFIPEIFGSDTDSTYNVNYEADITNCGRVCVQDSARLRLQLAFEDHPDSILTRRTVGEEFVLKVSLQNLGEAAVDSNGIIELVVPASSGIVFMPHPRYEVYHETLLRINGITDDVPYSIYCRLSGYDPNSENGADIIARLIQTPNEINRNTTAIVENDNDTIIVKPLRPQLTVESLWLNDVNRIDRIISTELETVVGCSLSWLEGINPESVRAALFWTLSDSNAQFKLMDSLWHVPDQNNCVFWRLQAPEISCSAKFLVEFMGQDITIGNTYSSQSDTLFVSIVERCRTTLQLEYSDLRPGSRDGTVSTEDKFWVDVFLDFNRVDGVKRSDTIFVNLSYPPELSIDTIEYQSNSALFGESESGFSSRKLRSATSSPKRDDIGVSPASVTGINDRSISVKNDISKDSLLSFVAPFPARSARYRICFNTPDLTNEQLRNGCLIQAKINDLKLPEDINSNFERISIAKGDTVLVLAVQNHLSFDVDSLSITRTIVRDGDLVVTDSPVEDSVTTRSIITIRGIVNNLGEANPQRWKGRRWENDDNVWISFKFDSSKIKGVNSKLVPIGKPFEDVSFEMKSAGVAQIVCNIMSDSVRDGNSEKSPGSIADTLCIRIFNHDEPTYIADSTSLTIDPRTENSAILSVYLQNNNDFEIKVYPDTGSIVLSAHSITDNGIRKLITGRDYRVATHSLTLPAHSSGKAVWQIALYVNQSKVEFNKLILDMYGASDESNKHFTYYEDGYGAPFRWRYLALESIQKEVDIAPPYLRNVLNKLVPGAPYYQRDIAFIFSENMKINGSISPDSLFETSPPHIFKSNSVLSAVRGDTVLVRAVLNPDLFESRNALYFKSTVKFDKNPRLAIGILTDLSGNNASKRDRYTLAENSLEVYPLEWVRPIIDANYQITSHAQFNFRVLDPASGGASGIDMSGLDIRLRKRSERTLYNIDSTTFDYVSLRSDQADSIVFNLSFSPADYTQSTALICSLRVADRAGNLSQWKVLNFDGVHNNQTSGTRIDESRLYPVPYDPSEPLYLQYNMTESRLSPLQVFIYNINGDKLGEIPLQGLKLIGSENSAVSGGHRYQLTNLDLLSKLPNGVYVVSFNFKGDDVKFQTFTLMRGAAYVR